MFKEAALTLSVCTWQPVFNARQQLVAIYPDFGETSFHDIFSLLGLWKELALFDKLPSILLMLRVPDLALLPGNLDTRFPVSRLVLCVNETACVDKEAQKRLNYFSGLGFHVMVDEFSAKSELSWDDTKSIAIDCANGVPFFSNGHCDERHP